MPKNTSLRQQNIAHITLDLIRQGIFLAYKDGITSRAPLGFSGDTVLLFGDRGNKEGSKSEVSIRNYSGDAELLITDKAGNFLFYGRYRIDMGIDWVAKQYYKVFQNCKPDIEREVTRIAFPEIPDSENVSYSEGYEILRGYFLNKASDSLLYGK